MKKKTTGPKNVKVYAVNEGKTPGFGIYVDFSGKRELLMHHRHNGLLYNVLKDGMSKDELDRFDVGTSSVGSFRTRKQMRQRKTRLQSSVGHLRHVLDEYLTEYAAAQAAA